MNRNELENVILENYYSETDFPWLKFPDYQVFRHPGNKKWFAVVMHISVRKLGLEGDFETDIVNFKCDPVLGGSLRLEKGIFPAYHMNKEKWITVSLDGSVADDMISMLLDYSFNATMPCVKRNK